MDENRHDSKHDEQGMSADEYWDRLSASFDADFMKSVEGKYDRRGSGPASPGGDAYARAC